MGITMFRQLIIICYTNQTTRLSLVGGNHTAARFCTR
ncbi:hypothetical protein Lser_V15G46000 [Lactuca serriola]